MYLAFYIYPDQRIFFTLLFQREWEETEGGEEREKHLHI